MCSFVEIVAARGRLANNVQAQQLVEGSLLQYRAWMESLRAQGRQRTGFAKRTDNVLGGNRRGSQRCHEPLAAIQQLTPDLSKGLHV